MLRTVRKVAHAENGSAFLNMKFNGSAKSTEKAPLKNALCKNLNKICCRWTEISLDEVKLLIV